MMVKYLLFSLECHMILNLVALSYSADMRYLAYNVQQRAVPAENVIGGGGGGGGAMTTFGDLGNYVNDFTPSPHDF